MDGAGRKPSKRARNAARTAAPDSLPPTTRPPTGAWRSDSARAAYSSSTSVATRRPSTPAGDLARRLRPRPAACSAPAGGRSASSSRRPPPTLDLWPQSPVGYQLDLRDPRGNGWSVAQSVAQSGVSAGRVNDDWSQRHDEWIGVNPVPGDRMAIHRSRSGVQPSEDQQFPVGAAHNPARGSFASSSWAVDIVVNRTLVHVGTLGGLSTLRAHLGLLHVTQQVDITWKWEEQEWVRAIRSRSGGTVSSGWRDIVQTMQLEVGDTLQLRPVLGARPCEVLMSRRQASRSNVPSNSSSTGGAAAPISVPVVNRSVGRSVLKEFPPNGMFHGTVVGYDQVARLYRVKYEDGDGEEMTILGLRGVLVPIEPATGPSERTRIPSISIKPAKNVLLVIAGAGRPIAPARSQIAQNGPAISSWAVDLLVNRTLTERGTLGGLKALCVHLGLLDVHQLPVDITWNFRGRNKWTRAIIYTNNNHKTESAGWRDIVEGMKLEIGDMLQLRPSGRSREVLLSRKRAPVASPRAVVPAHDPGGERASHRSPVAVCNTASSNWAVDLLVNRTLAERGRLGGLNTLRAHLGLLDVRQPVDITWTCGGQEWNRAISYSASNRKTESRGWHDIVQEMMLEVDDTLQLRPGGRLREVLMSRLRVEGTMTKEPTAAVEPGQAAKMIDVQIGDWLDVQYAADQRWYRCSVVGLNAKRANLSYVETAGWRVCQESVLLSSLTMQTVRRASVLTKLKRRCGPRVPSVEAFQAGAACDDVKLAAIVSMGFDQRKAKEMLDLAAGDQHQAIEMLLDRCDGPGIEDACSNSWGRPETVGSDGDIPRASADCQERPESVSGSVDAGKVDTEDRGSGADAEDSGSGGGDGGGGILADSRSNGVQWRGRGQHARADVETLSIENVRQFVRRANNGALLLQSGQSGSEQEEAERLWYVRWLTDDSLLIKADARRPTGHRIDNAAGAAQPPSRKRKSTGDVELRQAMRGQDNEPEAIIPVIEPVKDDANQAKKRIRCAHSEEVEDEDEDDANQARVPAAVTTMKRPSSWSMELEDGDILPLRPRVGSIGVTMVRALAEDEDEEESDENDEDDGKKSASVSDVSSASLFIDQEDDEPEDQGLWAAAVSLAALAPVNTSQEAKRPASETGAASSRPKKQIRIYSAPVTVVPRAADQTACSTVLMTCVLFSGSWPHPAAAFITFLRLSHCIVLAGQTYLPIFSWFSPA